MNPNEMRLKDAGHRELAFAQTLIDNDRLPKYIDYDTLINHGIYNASRDEIIFNVKSTTFIFPVNRP